jgi:hypothetical protein
MRTKRSFWGLLALGLAPFLLEATGGCHRIFELDEVVPTPGHNALYCDCSCEAADTREIRVLADSDDAEQSSSGSVDLGSSDLDLGDALVGVRFTNLGLLQGAKIAHAYVEFEGDQDGEAESASYTIHAEASTTAATFSSADGDLSGRTRLGTSVAWQPGPWNNGELQRTEDIGALLQELVNDPLWDASSTIVLLVEGTGQRSAESHDGDSDSAARLIVDLGVAAVLPVCATAPDPDSTGLLAPDALVNECNTVAATLTGLAGECGYPTPCSCTVVDRKSESGENQPDSLWSQICEAPCAEEPTNAGCGNFDPNAFTQCIQGGGTVAACKEHVAATNAAGSTPVCVHSGSALAFHAFGERTLCEVEGVTDISVGGNAPKDDPTTIGRVELVGEPCPGGDCIVHPFFDLVMNPIDFEVRFARDPRFNDLSAAGLGLEAALVDAGQATFPSDGVAGSGLGRRSSDRVGIDAMNPEPLGVGVDWIGRTCNLDGALAVGVGDDGVCAADGTIPCTTDDDCTAVGGACDLPEETAEMVVDLLLGGALVNQPPNAAAGADQSVECTSTAGASFLLDGRGTHDPDQNLALSVWHAGTRTGPELGRRPLIQQALAVGAAQSYVLRVVDLHAQTDEDTTEVAVVDTTPPEIACNAPATIRPPQAEPGLAFTATASDVCDEQVDAVVAGSDCFTFTKKGRRVSKLESCVVSFADATLTVHDVGGYGDVIEWTVGALDDSGNLGEATCQVVVAK